MPLGWRAVVPHNLVVIGSGLGTALAALVVAGQNSVQTTHAAVATRVGTFVRAAVLVGDSACVAELESILSKTLGRAFTIPPPFAMARNVLRD